MVDIYISLGFVSSLNIKVSSYVQVVLNVVLTKCLLKRCIGNLSHSYVDNKSSPACSVVWSHLLVGLKEAFNETFHVASTYFTAIKQQSGKPPAFKAWKQVATNSGVGFNVSQNIQRLDPDLPLNSHWTNKSSGNLMEHPRPQAECKTAATSTRCSVDVMQVGLYRCWFLGFGCVWDLM